MKKAFSAFLAVLLLVPLLAAPTRAFAEIQPYAQTLIIDGAPAEVRALDGSYERNTFLSGLDGFIAFLGSGKGRIQVGLVSVPVAVERKDKRVERGDRDISGIKSRSGLSVCVEKAAAFRACLLQRFGQQFPLALRGILF
jgi:hypothetical protein